MPADATSTIWRAASLGDYFWGRWDDSDEIVLYFSGSGSTYLITRLGYLILERLRESPKTQQALIDSITSTPGLSDDLLPIPEEMIESHLFHFRKLGLVEP